MGFWKFLRGWGTTCSVVYCLFLGTAAVAAYASDARFPARTAGATDLTWGIGLLFSGVIASIGGIGVEVSRLRNTVVAHGRYRLHIDLQKDED